MERVSGVGGEDGVRAAAGTGGQGTDGRVPVTLSIPAERGYVVEVRGGSEPEIAGFWESIGIDARDAARRLEATPVAVRALHAHRAGPLIEALCEHLEDHRAASRVLFMESLAAGSEAMEFRDQLQRRVAVLIAVASQAEDADEQETPAILDDLIGGLFRLFAMRLRPDPGAGGELSPAELASWVESYVGVLTMPVVHDKLRLVELGSDELVLIVAPAHPLATRQRIAPADLATRSGPKNIRMDRPPTSAKSHSRVWRTLPREIRIRKASRQRSPKWSRCRLGSVLFEFISTPMMTEQPWWHRRRLPRYEVSRG